MKNQFIRLFYSDTEIGATLSIDGSDAKKTMREFKQEVKDAKTELLNVSAAFGATSKEALTAAKRVAELEDNIKDASETAKLFDPGNRFQAVGNAVRGLVGGFTALQGALALAGVEGEEVQKTLLKVQGALALTEGLNVIADVTKDFQRLGSVLVQTLGKSGLIGVAIVGVTALGLAISGVFNKKQTEEVQALNDSLKDYSKAAGEARQKTVEVKIAFEQARAGVISKEQALKVYNDTLGDSLGKTNDLGKAEKLLADKAEVYIKITALKAQANALFAIAAQKTAEALIKQDELLRSGILDEGGLYGRAGANIKKNTDAAIASGKEIEALGANLLRQAGQLSGAFNINTGTPIAEKKTPTTTKGVDPKEEQRRLDLENEKRFRDEYNFIQYQAEQKRIADEKALRDAESADKIDDNKYLNETLLADNKNTEVAFTDLLNANVTIRKRLSEEEAAARAATFNSIANAASALSDLLGEQTAAGKVLAIAAATINTYAAIAGQLKAFAGIPVPGYAIAQAIATGIFGLAQVKKIIGVKVPGKGAGGGSISLPSASAPAPLRAQAPIATNTILNQEQLNQIGNATVRAFVIESDVTTNQERIRRTNRAARI
jgi:hypothetical protein